MVPRPFAADRRGRARDGRLIAASVSSAPAPAPAAGAFAGAAALVAALVAALSPPSAVAQPTADAQADASPSDGVEGGASRTPAALEPRLTVRHYDIAGDTVESVRTELVRKGPKGFHAWTEWRVEYRVRWTVGGDNRCRLSGADFDISADMLLPRWTPGPAAEPGLPERWRRYSEALRMHEDGHVAMAREAARDARQRMLTVGPQACDRLPAELRRAFDAAIGKARADERAYDARTAHGGAQGATF